MASVRGLGVRGRGAMSSRRQPATQADTQQPEESAAEGKAHAIAVLRGQLRLVHNMMKASPASAAVARRAAKLQFKLWKLTMSRSDIPNVQEAYKHALTFADNANRPQMWLDMAHAYIRCGRAWLQRGAWCCFEVLRA